MYAVVVAVVFDTDVIVIKRSVEVGGREVCVGRWGPAYTCRTTSDVFMQQSLAPGVAQLRSVAARLLIECTSTGPVPVFTACRTSFDLKTLPSLSFLSCLLGEESLISMGKGNHTMAQSTNR